MTLTTEQQEIRRTRLTASDWAAVVGLNKYRNAIDVFLEKTGQVEPFGGNEFTLWGTKLERLIADEYAERMGVTIEESGTLVHPKFDWIAATPDRIVLAHERYGLECKNRSAYNAFDWGEPGSDQTPDDVAVQCQIGMEVTELKRWDAAVLMGGNRLGIYTLEYDHELVEGLLEIGYDFWHDFVLKNICPPLDGTQSSVDYMNRKWRAHGGLILTAEPETAQFAEELRALRDRIKAAETEETRLENLIKDAIGAESGVALPDGKEITWKASKPRETTDWKAIAAALSDLVPAEEYEQIVKENTDEKETARTFRVPRNW